MLAWKWEQMYIYSICSITREGFFEVRVNTLVTTSKCRQSSSSCLFRSCDSLVIVERMPTTLLSSCLQKLSRNPLSSSTKQKNASAPAEACSQVRHIWSSAFKLSLPRHVSEAEINIWRKYYTRLETHSNKHAIFQKIQIKENND